MNVKTPDLLLMINHSLLNTDVVVVRGDPPQG